MTLTQPCPLCGYHELQITAGTSRFGIRQKSILAPCSFRNRSGACQDATLSLLGLDSIWSSISFYPRIKDHCNYFAPGIGGNLVVLSVTCFSNGSSGRLCNSAGYPWPYECPPEWLRSSDRRCRSWALSSGLTVSLKSGSTWSKAFVKTSLKAPAFFPGTFSSSSASLWATTVKPSAVANLCRPLAALTCVPKSCARNPASSTRATATVKAASKASRRAGDWIVWSEDAHVSNICRSRTLNSTTARSHNDSKALAAAAAAARSMPVAAASTLLGGQVVNSDNSPLHCPSELRAASSSAR
mmetsp:Transcript_17764/g.28925  ORF Transcript_17764/g.28925 Transcript_17764/m.28925 type:complete len:299 (+) Transcript_17764:70-966(+)